MAKPTINPLYSIFVILLLSVVAVSCEVDSTQKSESALFQLLSADRTNIDFENRLEYDHDFNIYKYRNFYNGGGVGIGDVNNDGLMDIYFTGNMIPNRLYLNKGSNASGVFQFEDITEKAGVAGKRAWSTGVSMVDINADGWLDMYVCNSGDVKGDNKQNEFFINNGPNGNSADGYPTFTEMAEALNLADQGFSTHAAFFDYDKDGDLDVYLLNNSYRSIGSFNLQENERLIRDKLGGDKLFRNDTPQSPLEGGRGVFTDVSEEAGIYGSVIGFGLGVAVSDLDKDGWLDLYISNDFFERDYIYMNNGDGTFREELEKQMRSISVASMGADIADISGDGYPEIFVTEMLPEPDDRFKTTMTFENWDKYQFNLENGYYHQFTRNMLHYHNGNIPGKGVIFSEVGRMLDVEATDWSWGALITDLDNDSYKDIFVSNGISQDILNQDYLAYIADEQVARSVITKEGVNFKKLIDFIPSNRIPNYAFSGGPDMSFVNKTKAWGLDSASHSNGAAYGDLDNDGDLDLVVNNVNMPVFLYQNKTDSSRHYLKIILEGSGMNTLAVGAKVTLKAGDRIFYQEQAPNRGFQSSVDNRLNFGLGPINRIDTLWVDWYYGKQTLLTNVKVNQVLHLKEEDATQPVKSKEEEKKAFPFREITTEFIHYKHQENRFSDFDRDRMLFHMISTEGPRIALGDVNSDGLTDIYAGGAKDAPGKLFVQLPNGTFKSTNEDLFEKDKVSEDIDCLLLDVDGDQDLDLYVTSGGSELPTTSFALVDRLYINDGQGNFSRSQQVLPAGTPESTSTVKASDMDGDGDLDLFVGVRQRSRLYGVPQNGYILQNDGKGNFTNVTGQIAPGLLNLGMITDAAFADYDKDGDDDLLVVGEWMSIKLFENNNGTFQDKTHLAGLSHTAGWWNMVEAADFNGDGFTDFVVGNHGLNSRFRASEEKPLSCYINDFDHNGAVEQIICMYNGDQPYPLALRHNLVMQIPQLKKKYLKYEAYKEQTIDDIFTEEELEGSVIHQVTLLESVVLLNKGNSTSDGHPAFDIQPLPKEVQISPVYGILVHDIDDDGNQDMVVGGNLHNVKPEVGRYDASYGLFLKGNGDGSFKAIAPKDSGLLLEGEIRDFALLKKGKTDVILVVRNNDSLQAFEYHK